MNHSFDFTTCCGLKLEVEYMASIRQAMLPYVKYAWLIVDDRPVEIFYDLNGDTQDAIQDAAISDWHKVCAEEKQRAAEAKADAEREEMLMAADPRSHGPDFE